LEESAEHARSSRTSLERPQQPTHAQCEGSGKAERSQDRRRREGSGKAERSQDRRRREGSGKVERSQDRRRRESPAGSVPLAGSVPPAGSVRDWLTPVIDLLDVKDEVVECVHSAAQINGERWPYTREMEVGLWGGNKVEEDGVKKLITSLDATLFQYNMRAWSSLQQDIMKYQDKFVFYHMNTSSGCRGLMVVCKECDKFCRIDWHKSDPDDAPKHEKCRRKLREYFNYGTRSEKMRQRIV